mmetsp:Transcript_28919/g.61916  ORF Transcript_28919/g.61916 Transcript_28919/m.61916 type:complete len:219 (+) Transcript_28919:65-721(+)
MNMSSLQRRMQQASKGQSTNTDKKTNTFESCFSSGLNLTELAGTDSVSRKDSDYALNPSAAAELAQLKMNDAERIKKEAKEEADLERRVAGVISSSKIVADSNMGDEMLNVDLRASNPHSRGHAAGVASRENNFLQFQTASMGTDNGFLSSLVQSHESELKDLNACRRKASKGNSVRSTDLRRGLSKIQARNKEKIRHQSARNSGKRLGAKKSRNYKY